jgi:hypothetical protein
MCEQKQNKFTKEISVVGNNVVSYCFVIRKYNVCRLRMANINVFKSLIVTMRI